MDKVSLIENLQSIANRHGIKKFVKISEGDKYCLANGQDVYINKSYLIGGNELHLGIYSDDQLMIASFFHELGHIVDSKNNKVNSELTAWIIGFQLAKSYGFNFNADVYLWALEQLATYENSY